MTTNLDKALIPVAYALAVKFLADAAMTIYCIVSNALK